MKRFGLLTLSNPCEGPKIYILSLTMNIDLSHCRYLIGSAISYGPMGQEGWTLRYLAFKILSLQGKPPHRCWGLARLD